MRVICERSEICMHREYCGAAITHDARDCEQCPFYPEAKCIEQTTKENNND